MKVNETVKFIMYVIVLVVLFFAIRLFLVTPVTVSGNSMMPTMEDGERTLGLKIGKVERFDIIAFPAPGEDGRNFIKRVIGLPGEKIEYKADVLYVDGKAIEEPFLEEEKAKMAEGELLTADFTFQDLAEGYATVSSMRADSDFEGAETVPKGKLFVLGDNRLNSEDSRMIGFIDEDAVIGNVKFTFWPVAHFGFTKDFS